MASEILLSDEEALTKLRAREDKRETSAKSPLTWSEFRRAALDHGFVIVMSSGPVKYKVAGYKNLRWRDPYTGKARPMEVGEYMTAYKEVKPYASIVTNIRMKSHREVKEYGTERFYDFDQCNRAFEKLANKLNRISGK